MFTLFQNSPIYAWKITPFSWFREFVPTFEKLPLSSWKWVRAWYTFWSGVEGPGHDDVIKWKHLHRYWPFVRGINRSPVNSPHKGKWHGVLMFSLICAWTNRWVNNRNAGDLRRHQAYYDVTVMNFLHSIIFPFYNDQNTDCLCNITLITDRCRQSLAVQ